MTPTQPVVSARELCHCNYVQKGTQILKVINIFGASGLLDLQNDAGELEWMRMPPVIGKISGIPISPEWLDRAGFVEDRNGYHLASDINSLSFSIDKDNTFLPCFNDRVISQHLRVYYVHQLQNLYFALTGEELKFKTK